MKKGKYLVLTSLSSVLMVVATIFVSVPKPQFLYAPEIPESLK